MQKREIEIYGKTYRFDFRTVWSPLYAYESGIGQSIPFDPSKLLCMHLLYYCILTISNKDFPLTLDDFLEALNDTELVFKLNKLYKEIMDDLEPVAQKVKREQNEETDSKKKS